MGSYYFVMGFPYSERKDDKQKELFTALKSHADKTPFSMTVYLIRSGSGGLYTVCQWPDGMGDLGDQLWGSTSIFKKWVAEANGPRYEDADILGPRTHGVEEVNGPSTVIDEFHT